MKYIIYDTERWGYWRIIMDLEHDLGVRLSDAIDSDGRFSFLYYRERKDINAFVIAVGLSAGSGLCCESNERIKAELRKICDSVLVGLRADSPGRKS